MKRAYALFLAAFLALVAGLPSMATSTAPESRFKSNLRIPQQLILGGNLRNSAYYGPNLVLRPADQANSTYDIKLTWTTPSAARTYTIPDAGANATFMLSGAAQTITGVQTFSSVPIFPTGGITLSGTSYNIILKALAAVGQATTVTIPDPGQATANVVLSAGTQTLAGTYTFSNPPTITGGLTAANIQTGSAKRQVLRVQLSPVTGAAADSTTYAGLCSFGRAGAVKRISFVCHVAPTVGTDTIEVLKNNTTTLLNAATYDANSLTADTVATATLTATTSDLSLAATDVIRCKYNAGSQTVDAQDVTAIIEFEPTDF